MQEFSSQITDDPYWPLLCLRGDTVNDLKDGYACTGESYSNLTAPAVDYIKTSGQEMNDENLQRVVNAFAPTIEGSENFRSMLGK